MKKISEMTIEELQDYALARDQENASLKDENKKLVDQNVELTDWNKALQRRNNDLFMQVEQQSSLPENAPQNGGQPEEIESCEDFARNLILGEK